MYIQIIKFDSWVPYDSATEICNFAKFTMFFQVESAENFSKFCLKGYVAKMAEKKILCMPCCKALGSVNHQGESIFLKLKDRGS